MRHLSSTISSLLFIAAGASAQSLDYSIDRHGCTVLERTASGQETFEQAAQDLLQEVHHIFGYSLSIDDIEEQNDEPLHNTCIDGQLPEGAKLTYRSGCYWS